MRLVENDLCNHCIVCVLLHSLPDLVFVGILNSDKQPVAVSLSSNDTQVFLYSDVFARRHSSIMLWYYEQILCASFFQDSDVQALSRVTDRSKASGCYINCECLG